MAFRTKKKIDTTWRFIARKLLMSQITEEQAIELAREFLEKDGKKIIKLLSARHCTKEYFERDGDGSFDSGSFYIRFSIVRPPNSKFIEDAICSVLIDDVTGEANYSLSY